MTLATRGALALHGLAIVAAGVAVCLGQIDQETFAAVVFVVLGLAAPSTIRPHAG